jgi:hypothetical protein
MNTKHCFKLAPKFKKPPQNGIKPGTEQVSSAQVFIAISMASSSGPDGMVCKKL